MICIVCQNGLLPWHNPYAEAIDETAININESISASTTNFTKYTRRDFAWTLAKQTLSLGVALLAQFSTSLLIQNIHPDEDLENITAGDYVAPVLSALITEPVFSYISYLSNPKTLSIKPSIRTSASAAVISSAAGGAIRGIGLLPSTSMERSVISTIIGGIVTAPIVFTTQASGGRVEYEFEGEHTSPDITSRLRPPSTLVRRMGIGMVVRATSAAISTATSQVIPVSYRGFASTITNFTSPFVSNITSSVNQRFGRRGQNRAEQPQSYWRAGSSH